MFTRGQIMYVSLNNTDCWATYALTSKIVTLLRIQTFMRPHLPHVSRFVMTPDFVWTNKKVKLLLNVILEYEVAKRAVSITSYFNQVAV